MKCNKDRVRELLLDNNKELIKKYGDKETGELIKSLYSDNVPIGSIIKNIILGKAIAFIYNINELDWNEKVSLCEDVTSAIKSERDKRMKDPYFRVCGLCGSENSHHYSIFNIKNHKRSLKNIPTTNDGLVWLCDDCMSIIPQDLHKEESDSVNQTLYQNENK